eukprot:114324-Prymnesium_polylepis.1
MWPLEVGVLQGGWVQQQQQEQQEHASDSNSSSSSSRRCARALQLCAGRVLAGCMCARMRRSEPHPSPAAPAHAACQPAQVAQSCARSGTFELAGSTGRSAGVQPCSVRRG